MSWSFFYECWVLTELFHSLLSLSSRGYLVLLLFSAMRVVSSAYLMLLIFLLEILIPSCASSSLAFHVVYSASKLHKRVTICSREVLLPLFGTIALSHVGVLTVASSPACRFLMRQIRWPGIPISLRIFQFVVILRHHKATQSHFYPIYNYFRSW